MISQICKWIVFKCIYPFVYFVGSRRRIDSKKIVFVESHGDRISDDFKLLFEETQMQGYKPFVHYLRISESAWSRIIVRTVRMIWNISTAKCVFLNESNSAFGAFDLRKDTQLVQLWHACGAFKRWGYSVAEKSFGDSKQTLDRYSGHRNYTLVSVSGEAVRWAYEEAFGLQDKPDVVKALGVSRTDVYFQDERQQKAYATLQVYDKDILSNKLRGRKVILYAPTFRGNIRGAKSPDQLDLKELSQLQAEYVILVKQHPFVKEKYNIPEEFSDFCIEVKDELSIEELLMVSDICITDYSSIVFEYSLMKKPIIFFAYDLEEYYDERGFYYPYEEFVPGPILKNTHEIVAKIQQLDKYDMDRLEEFSKQYMSGCDGHSTKRIMEYVLVTGG